MNETTKNILNFDPVATAEALIGKRHEEWDVETDGMAALGLAMMSNQSKREHLESIGDTHFGITWQDFIEIVRTYGFKCGFCQKFTGTGWSDEKGIEEEEIIFFHEEKGLILHAESFDGKSVNSAKVYGEVKINETLTENQWDALNGCSHGGNGNGTMYFDVDVREGFRFHISTLFQKHLNFLQVGLKFRFCGSLTTWIQRKRTTTMRKSTKRKLRLVHQKYRKLSLDNHSKAECHSLYKGE